MTEKEVKLWAKDGPNPTDYINKKAEETSLSIYSLDFAKKLDEEDSLARFRDEFFFPEHQSPNHDASSSSDEKTVYLCGNSLGLQSKKSRRRVENFLQHWAKSGVAGHFTGENPWLTCDAPLVPLMAKLVGALPEEVAIMNSLSVNLHLLLVAFYRPTKERFKIILESGAFCSDRYVAESQTALHGFNFEDAVVYVESEGLTTEEKLYQKWEEEFQKHGDSTAVLLLGGVNFQNGLLFPIADLVKLAHKYGVIVGLDLAHATGNVPLELHDWNVDFAVWCNYKYMNAGPGTIGGAFVHWNHSGNPPTPVGKESVLLNPKHRRLAGWWGHNLSTRFQMDDSLFIPIPGAEGYRISNPPVFEVESLYGSLETFTEAGGMIPLRQKSILLTRYLEMLLDNLSLPNIKILTPKEFWRRGAQLSIYLGDPATAKYSSKEAEQKLEGVGVFVDSRRGNVIRASPAPLYNSFVDVWKFVQRFKALYSE